MTDPTQEEIWQLRDRLAQVTGKLERLQTFVDTSAWQRDMEALRRQLATVTAERDEWHGKWLVLRMISKRLEAELSDLRAERTDDQLHTYSIELQQQLADARETIARLEQALEGTRASQSTRKRRC